MEGEREREIRRPFGSPSGRLGEEKSTRYCSKLQSPIGSSVFNTNAQVELVVPR